MITGPPSRKNVAPKGNCRDYSNGKLLVAIREPRPTRPSLSTPILRGQPARSSHRPGRRRDGDDHPQYAAEPFIDQLLAKRFSWHPAGISSFYPMTKGDKDAETGASAEGREEWRSLLAANSSFSVRNLGNWRRQGCAFLLSLVLPAQATSFTRISTMSDSEYAQKRR